MSLVDTHCHLNFEPLSDDMAGVLARARARGVDRVVVPAYDEATWVPIAGLSSRDGVHTAFGLHPWVVHTLENGSRRPSISDFTQRLGDCLSASQPVAIGEIGLDTKIEESGLEEQLPVLEAQLTLAADLDLPVILHCRGAFEELLGAVNKHGGLLRGVLHAYSRGPDPASRFIAAGINIALGGAVTRDRAKRVRKAAVELPLERMLLETDAPSIGLEGVLPAETEPHHVADIAAAVAELRGQSVAEIAAVTTHNAERLFGLA